MMSMAEYDGSVKINTKIDSDGFYLGIKKMSASTMQLNNSIQQTQNQVFKLTNEIKAMENTDVEPKSVTKLKEKLEQVQDEAAELRNYLDDVSKTDVLTVEYEYMANSLDRAKTKLEQLINRQDKMSATGVGESSKQWKNLQYDIENVKREIASTEAEMQDMRLSGDAFQSVKTTQQYSELEARLQSLTAKQNQYNAQLKETEAREKQIKEEKLSKKRASLEKLNEKLGVYNRRLEEAKKRELGMSKNLKGLKDASAQLGKLTLGSKAFGSLSGFGGMVNTLTSRLKSLVLSAFVFNVLSKGLRSLQERMSNCLSTNYAYNASLKQIKGNLMTAFYPIYSFALPAINTLMSALQKITGTIAVFTSKLFGTSAAKSQQGAKNLLQQASALDSVGKAAEKANNNLSDIDDMHILTDNSEDSSSGGASGAAQDYSFGEIETDNKLLDWLDRMQEKFEPLTSALKRLFEAAKPLAGPFFEGFIDGLTELITSDTAVGIINQIAEALENMDPDEAYEIGKALGEIASALILIGGIAGIAGLVASLGSLWEILLPLLVFISGWKIGNGLYTLITGEEVDMTMWEQLDEIFGTLFNDSGTFFDALGNMIYDAKSEFLSWFGIESPTWEEFKEGVSQGWQVVKDKWGENGILGIAELAADGIAQKLGINADVWAKLKNAASDVLNKYKTAFQDEGIAGVVKLAFEDMKTSIIQILSPTFLSHIFQKLVDSVKAKFINVGSEMGNSVGRTFANAVNGIFGTIERIINKFISSINNIRLIINAIPGVSMAAISPISLPRLATGTVVPANYGEFQAILGDNKREPEIVSPLSTMRKAVREELDANGGSGRIIRIYQTIQLDGRVVYETVKDYNEREIDRTGNNPLFA